MSTSSATAEAQQNVCAAVRYDVIRRSTAFKWFKSFRVGIVETKDQLHSGRPIELGRRAVTSAIEGNRNLTTRVLAHESENGCLTRKKKRVDDAKELLDRHKQEAFLHRVVLGRKTTYQCGVIRSNQGTKVPRLQITRILKPWDRPADK